MRDYIENGGKRIPLELKQLLLASELIPVSTAECERGFSAIHQILTTTRCFMKLSCASQLMLIRLIGPPLRFLNP